jgi:sugar O-acyltransferase (sialic acid O-acetyltransferase NeuD family)
MSVRELLLVGAGGFGRETAEAVRAINQRNESWKLLGFLDDATTLQGGEVGGLPVLGPIDAVDRYVDAAVAVCTGHPGNYFSRKRIVRRLGLDPARYATLVHPGTTLAASTAVGPGSIVLAAVVTTAAVQLGAHVAVMPGVILTHDDEVADYATFGAGARLAGRVRVGEGAYVGSGAMVREDRTIGAWSLVGMGSVVLDDVPPAEVWAGVPACRLRAVDLPSDPR